ncbi:MAG: hypothetical protein KF869_04910 [Phycisphaeraceae bacterium]|nr:hypothetical protein [Phycisphaeraceae bacterium]
MNHSVHSDDGAVPLQVPGFGPRTVTTLCGCALASTAYVLGATWLESPWLGLPLGVWLIGAGVGAAHLWTTRGPAITAAAGRGRVRVPRGLAASLTTDNVLATVMELSGVPARSVQTARRRMREMADNAGLKLTPRAIRIGLDLSHRDHERLCAVGASGLAPGLAVEWVRAPAGLMADAPHDAAAFDALVRREPEGRGGSGAAAVFVPEHGEFHAAWKDWAAPASPGYAQSFPVRLDPGVIRLEQCDFADPLHARLAADIIVLGAALGAGPARRPGGIRSVIRGGALDNETARSAVEVAMLRLAGTLEDLAAAADRNETSIPPAARSAARVLSAWLTAWQAQPGTPPIHHERCRLAQLAAGFLDDEPEAALRLGATQIAAFEDRAAMTTFRRARDMLRADARACPIDPLAFIQSEIEMGAPNGLTLGRVAAGLVLLWGTTPADSAHYLRDDLLDDLRHSGWLAQREQDCKVLAEVLEELARDEDRRRSVRAEAA